MMPCNFAWAFAELLKPGVSAIWRHGWNNNLQRVRLQVPDAGSANTEPYLFIEWKDKLGNARRTPWVPSMGDLFAEDWDCE